ncbi:MULTISPECIES: hypothetical protein [unclassified Microcystis]|jgi:hypothetical protein|uniref:hypothetical protein n=1 Tax=unclassified Microcystis TaxID=2643300 RepID=UPI002584EC12|nr:MULTISPECIES: hypothetical protein [unclassified Microcystis]MCA2761707.1 hypothetical protein [Microcystis sp. M151S2]MCA2643319.1 hypothetical protein [Microcystis sp. M087S2]MCA2670405.1 hypothetical protein [Microcystis sp. M080S2]MCA2688001.1 hypothetical protein [Microcystis sp. M037S2]MCA2733892.1 hypothetical protein [Microcystis sp. M158S2]
MQDHWGSKLLAAVKITKKRKKEPQRHKEHEEHKDFPTHNFLVGSILQKNQGDG